VTLDLSNPDVYRDLTKPIGALNDERLATLKENRKHICDPLESCLYRTHYSNPLMVIGYLVRMEPFTTSTLHCRMVAIIHRIACFSQFLTFGKVSGLNSDFCELIPEFFCNPQFLTNENGFDLGIRHLDGVTDVTLPVGALLRVPSRPNLSTAGLTLFLEFINGRKNTIRSITAFLIRIPCF
jgi:hypothetical protein